MIIYLIRHGQSTSDIENRYGGDYDDSLTEKGRQQAQELAKKLSGGHIEIIFSSPRFRAKETAQILQKSLKCKLEIVDDLRERNNYGIMTGMKKSEAAKLYPDQVALLEDTHNTIKGGEPYELFAKRVLRAFNRIAKSKHETVVIATHAGPIRCIFRELLKKELKDLKDCEVFELDTRKWAR